MRIAMVKGTMDAVKLRVQTSTICMLLACFLAGSASATLASSAPRHNAARADLRVNINRASVDELLQVPGMTRTWAGRIVRFRPYRTKQDLLDRGVLSGEVYRRVKDSLIAHRDKR